MKHEKVQLWKDGPYWATTNIGAVNPNDPGLLFMWGDTVGYESVDGIWTSHGRGCLDRRGFISDNCPTYEKSLSELLEEDFIKGNGIISQKHDAANANWGDGWRMPTVTEMEMLLDLCDWDFSIGGYVVRGRGNYENESIFLPCAGTGCRNLTRGLGSYGRYWSSVPHPDEDYYAFGMCFYPTHISGMVCHFRHYGFSIRPVQC